MTYGEKDDTNQPMVVWSCKRENQKFAVCKVDQLEDSLVKEKRRLVKRKKRTKQREII